MNVIKNEDTYLINLTEAEAKVMRSLLEYQLGVRLCQLDYVNALSDVSEEDEEDMVEYKICTHMLEKVQELPEEEYV